MNYETVTTQEIERGLILTLNRPEQKNSINTQLLKDINSVLDTAEKNSQCCALIIAGLPGTFCIGLDFSEMSKYSLSKDRESINAWTTLYMTTLKRFTSSSKIIIAKVDGSVIAGGMGLVAASDLVLATSNSSFVLTEALWGLLPAMVLPFLIRRVGFQKAYKMTLTTSKITAQEALSAQLIDEITENPEEVIQLWMKRLTRLEETTVIKIKSYFRTLWTITEEMESAAPLMTAALLQEEATQRKIKNFLEKKQMPWE